MGSSKYKLTRHKKNGVNAYPKTLVEAVFWDKEKKPLDEVLDGIGTEADKVKDKLDAPATPGSASQVLQLDANGKTSWVDAATGGTYDSALSDSSTNAPQNKVVTAKLAELGQKVDGNFMKELSWSNGYINTSGTIVSSTLSKFTQPFTLYAGESVQIYTNTGNVTVIGTTNAVSLSVGDSVTPIAVNPGHGPYDTFTYTAQVDTTIVLGVKWSDYTLAFRDAYNLEDRVAKLESGEDVIDFSGYDQQGYWNRATGVFTPHNDYIATPKIAISLAKKVTIKNTYANQYNVAAYCFFDAKGTFLGANDPVSSATTYSSIVFDENNPVPDGAAFIAVGCAKTQTNASTTIKYDLYYANDNTLQREIDSIKEDIKAYNAVSASDDSMASGDELVLTDYPKTIKKGDRVTFEAKFSSYAGSITIGKGFTAYQSRYFEITSTQVIFKAYGNSESTIATESHGLTMDTFIRVYLEENANTWKIKILTLGGIYEHEFSQEGGNGDVRVKVSGMSLTDAKLSAFNVDLQNDIWAFGDSYFGIISNAREMYYINQWGYLNFMIAGYPGMSSSTGWQDLQRCLKLAKPKYIIWCLGMNDNGTLASWKGYIDNLVSLCSSAGIIPILSTIPKPKSGSYVNKPEMSNYVRSLGVRFLDAERAVGANTSTGAWYGNGTADDYQSSDNVHPTAMGARAIAVQFLVDVPEITE